MDYMVQQYLKDSILATLVYYDNFDFPLSLLELYRYLINPGRVSKLPDTGIEDVTVGSVSRGVEDLVKSGRVQSKNGFYFLSGRSNLYDTRIAREKIAAQKWKKIAKVGAFFRHVPFLRAVWVSGSIAMANTGKDSDLDVIIVAKSGRLYTLRFILSLVASLFRSRRTRFEVTAPDKFCFNHYLTESSLSIPFRSLFVAQAYCHLKPFFDPDKLLNKFYLENLWMHSYVLHGGSPPSILNSVPSTYLPKAISSIGGKILGNFVGNLIERFGKWYQQRRIKSNPVTYEKGGRVIFEDNVLEFHPRSFENVVLRKYNSKLEQLGILRRIKEEDSGLLM